ncbi:MliC family protein [Klebsiella aerogenes]|uniref:MliC family protein n=1 Tax=Klebsiella aerogenes TaxID=548 RepID=UPI001F22DA63|nr:MliC family protein [Klebsiella aerogenes]
MKRLSISLLSLLLSGCSYYIHLKDEIQTDKIEYLCDEGPLMVEHNSARKEVYLTLDNTPLILSQGLSAAGERFTDGVYVYWSKDNQVTIYRHDWVIRHNCIINAASGSSSLFPPDFFHLNHENPTNTATTPDE